MNNLKLEDSLVTLSTVRRWAFLEAPVAPRRFLRSMPEFHLASHRHFHAGDSQPHPAQFPGPHDGLGIEGAALAVLSSQVLSAVASYRSSGLVPSKHVQAVLLPELLGACLVFASGFLGLPLIQGDAVLVLGYAILLVLRARSIRRDLFWRTSPEES